MGAHGPIISSKNGIWKCKSFPYSNTNHMNGSLSMPWPFPSTSHRSLKEHIIRMFRNDLEANIMKGWVASHPDSWNLEFSEDEAQLCTTFLATPYPGLAAATPVKSNGTWSLNSQNSTDKTGVIKDEQIKGGGLWCTPHNPKLLLH